jgi:hypothetical protein
LLEDAIHLNGSEWTTKPTARVSKLSVLTDEN